MNSLSRVRLFATSWTVAYQAPPSVGFSRQEYWSGLPFPSPGDLSNPGIKPRDQTQVSRIASRRFTILATREDSKDIIKNSDLGGATVVRWRHWGCHGLCAQCQDAHVAGGLDAEPETGASPPGWPDGSLKPQPSLWWP